MLNNGQYLGKVAPGGPSCVFGKSAKKGTPQVTVLVEVYEGHHIGEQMQWIGYLSGGAKNGTIGALRTMGFIGDDLADFDQQSPETVFPFTVGTEPYNGKDYTKITRIGGALEMSKAELKALAEEINPTLAQFKPAADPLNGDEPPF